MDPDANLKEMLELAKEINAESNMADPVIDVVGDQAFRLAELVESLDEWLVKGGFKPKRWS